MVRILIGVVGPRDLRWVLRFADDFLLLVRSGAVSRPLLMAILLVRALSIPLKCSKFRAAGPLRFVRPFLGPLYAWCAAASGQRSADPPPLVVLVLEWLAEEFDEKRRTSCVPSTKALGEMFRSDAKAEGQKVVVGWELAGSERACDARWFPLGLSSAEIPWVRAWRPVQCHLGFGAARDVALPRRLRRGTVSLTTGLLWTSSPPPSIRWAWC